MKDAPIARMGEMWAKTILSYAKEMLTLGKREKRPFVDQ